MQIRRLEPEHAAGYRELMLQAFAEDPEAFTSTVSEREFLPLEWWASRLSDAPDAGERVLEEARSKEEIELVQLTVSETNVPARRLYEACGFTPFGTEPMALKYGDRYVSLVHMWRPLDDGAPGESEP